MRQTLVFMWNSALWVEFNLRFSEDFCKYWQNFHFGRRTRYLLIRSVTREATRIYHFITSLLPVYYNQSVFSLLVKEKFAKPSKSLKILWTWLQVESPEWAKLSFRCLYDISNTSWELQVPSSVKQSSNFSETPS